MRPALMYTTVNHSLMTNTNSQTISQAFRQFTDNLNAVGAPPRTNTGHALDIFERIWNLPRNATGGGPEILEFFAQALSVPWYKSPIAPSELYARALQKFTLPDFSDSQEDKLEAVIFQALLVYSDALATTDPAELTDELFFSIVEELLVADPLPQAPPLPHGAPVIVSQENLKPYLVSTKNVTDELLALIGFRFVLYRIPHTAIDLRGFAWRTHNSEEWHVMLENGQIVSCPADYAECMHDLSPEEHEVPASLLLSMYFMAPSLLVSGTLTQAAHIVVREDFGVVSSDNIVVANLSTEMFEGLTYAIQTKLANPSAPDVKSFDIPLVFPGRAENVVFHFFADSPQIFSSLVHYSGNSKTVVVRNEMPRLDHVLAGVYLFPTAHELLVAVIDQVIS